jgi:predicted alpha/beta hydrolase family esterase
MKGQVLFVHGGGEGAHAADGRLAASLREAMGDDLGVRYPKMPGEDAPEYGAWRGRISEELTRMSGEVILVGHSLGASILLKYLSEEEPEKPIAGVFLLAAPFWGAEDWEVEEYELRENFASKLPEGLPVSLYHGRDDEVVPFEHLALYAKKLPHATVRELGGRGHQFGDDLSDLARDIGEILSGARAERTAATARERRPRQPEEDA